MGYPGRIKGGIWVESGVIGAETAENLCWGFGCREEGFFAKVSLVMRHSTENLMNR